MLRSNPCRPVSAATSSQQSYPTKCGNVGCANDKQLGYEVYNTGYLESGRLAGTTCSPVGFPTTTTTAAHATTTTASCQSIATAGPKCGDCFCKPSQVCCPDPGKTSKPCHQYVEIVLRKELACPDLVSSGFCNVEVGVIEIRQLFPCFCLLAFRRGLI
jgi:hypothetical protein